jgi:aspartate ammonia-lyase
MTAKTRFETDSLGTMELPADLLWGIHTQRAIENFPISGIKLSLFPEVIRALGAVKLAAARANCTLGVLPAEKARVIESVCANVMAGAHDDAFAVDMIQGGAGTSTNMNANEVIANLGLRRMGRSFGDYQYLHPNDHVNKSQSTNDVYPTAMRLAIVGQCADFCAAQNRLITALSAKAVDFAKIKKIGRTQLQDALPMTLGQEFASWANTIAEDVQIIQRLSQLLLEVNLGGTAIGTRVNTPAGYADVAVAELGRVTGLPVSLATDLIEASSDCGAYVTFSGVLKRIAVKLSKICNDLRLLSSGPRSGFMEIYLPAMQAGSSIMPGKVNPVIPEVVNQIAFQVIGNDLTITMAAEAGQLQLNAFEPVIMLNILQSMRILMSVMDTRATR